MLKNPFRELDNKKKKTESSLLKKNADFNKLLNSRMQIIAIVVAIIFGLVVYKLYVIQIKDADEYAIKLEAYESKKQLTTTPRGKILDANGNVLVGNVQSLNVVYNSPKSIDDEEEWALCEKFAKQFNVDYTSLTERDLKELWLLLDVNESSRLSNGNSKLSDDEYEQAMRDKLNSKEVYNLKLSRISVEDVAKIPVEKKQGYAIKKILNSGTEGQSDVILENVSTETAAYLSEHEADYPGFSISFDWSRTYPYNDVLRSVLGGVSTSKQGVPKESQDYYSALGYPLNERVGTSGLEEQYEVLLSGNRNVSEIKYDANGTPIFNEISNGRNGYDLQMSIDVELQKKIDEILIKHLNAEKDNPKRKYLSSLYVTLMNPETGEIYAMSGKTRNDEGNILDNASGNYLEANVPGSVVKGGTVFMGLNAGVVKPGELVLDQPIKLKGTPEKSSYSSNIGNIDEIGALAKSSNVYMWQIVMRMGGTNYTPDCPLVIDPTLFSTMRHNYTQFGLGIKTGLDVPSESIGFSGTNTQAGLALDYAIGQYDSYTPIQLVQYVSTIANGGKRIKPRLVTYGYETNADKKVMYENKPTVLNTIDGNLDYLKNVQQGFRACIETGFCGGKMKGVKTEVAAKTGTAETYYLAKDGEVHKITNASMVGYAPYDKPKVAFSCVAPNSSTEELQSNMCFDIMPEVLDEFLKKY
ncbi:MAG: penicillin-binding protein 2 [Erysipelotrichaceae bacterium]